MSKERFAAACVLILMLGAPCLAQDKVQPRAASQTPPSLLDRETLTDNWFGLGRQLADEGIAASLGLTQIYQVNLDGGLSTHRRSGRYAGSWDLEFDFDLEKLAGLAGGLVHLTAEGSWSAGLDASSIGSVFGVNADAAGDRAIDVTQLYYEQALLDGRVIFRVGKLDLGGGFECRGCPVAFDGNAFANDETAQFLNGALVNNPTIGFPDKGLGLVLYVEPAEGWYLSAGVADAQADARETGFNTAFHDEDYFFCIFETGIAPQLPSSNGPLQGAYRVGFWYDPQPKARHAGGYKRDDLGMYLSFDQMVAKENADDDQGLGLFARFGLADDDVSGVEWFWSVGGQYQGLIPGRDDDVLGVGAAQGRLVGGAGYTTDHETVIELYYNAAVTPWLSVSPSVQYIFNPGGNSAVGDAIVLGVRAQISL